MLYLYFIVWKGLKVLKWVIINWIMFVYLKFLINWLSYIWVIMIILGMIVDCIIWYLVYLINGCFLI